jgi:N-acetylglucosaminyl-diphospho-decaprenol L-rhamnosyltransferase
VSRAPDDIPSLYQLSAVVVLFNSADVIGRCLSSIPREVEVILVDNASVDEGGAIARSVRPDASLIHANRNVGFGAGCNLGWRTASRPYVAFINPDVRVRPDTLITLLRRMAEETHSMVGPLLLDEAGRPRPCKRRSSVWLDLCGLLPAAARWAPVGWDGKLDRAASVHNDGGTVDTVEGACFLISRRDLETVGGFDEDFFLYYEEESLALRLEEIGGAAVYEPRAVAEHAGAASTSKVAALANVHINRSRIIFYRKRDGTVRGGLAAGLFGLGVLVSVPFSLVNLVLRRKRTETPRYFYQVLRGLLAGMTATLHREIHYPRDRIRSRSTSLPCRTRATGGRRSRLDAVRR